MRIRVASGKGGTGKTTIATNLALSVGAEMQLLDCDVEEPSAHFLSTQPWQKQKRYSHLCLKLMKKSATFAGNAAIYAGLKPSRW